MGIGYPFGVLPTHVSIIMDGNGRWAKERGKERVQGHFEGVESVRAVMEASREWGIRYVSLYAFSEENWGRPQAEVDALMGLMLKCMVKELPTFIENGIHLRVLGNRERLSDELNATIDRIDKTTEGGRDMTMILFVSYSGKWDLLQATRKLASEGRGEDITMDDISSRLVTAGIPDPDVIIRTSGEKRLSNYLLWQGAYSEFVFVDTLWPDFRKDEYLAALKEFASRDRRFGKVK